MALITVEAVIRRDVSTIDISVIRSNKQHNMYEIMSEISWVAEQTSRLPKRTQVHGIIYRLYQRHHVYTLYRIGALKF